MHAKTKMALNGLAGCSLIGLLVSPAIADVIPYGNPGTENPTAYSFAAQTTGEIRAYVYATSSADFTDTLGLLVNGVATGQTGPRNKDAAGNYRDLGFARKGAVLTFTLDVSGIGNQPYSSDPGQNYGGVNLLYSTNYAGGSGIPAGTYLGWEDLDPANNPPVYTSDFNYTDARFVFASVAAVPLPAAAPLFGLSLLSLGALSVWLKRRTNAAAV